MSYISTAEAAALLKRDVGYVYEWVSGRYGQKRLRGKKAANGRWRIDRASAEALAEVLEVRRRAIHGAPADLSQVASYTWVAGGRRWHIVLPCGHTDCGATIRAQYVRVFAGKEANDMHRCTACSVNAQGCPGCGFGAKRLCRKCSRALKDVAS